MAAHLSRVDWNFEQNDTHKNTEVLVDGLKNLMKDDDSHDVIFVIGNDKARLGAHSLILKARCGKFRSQAPKSMTKPQSPTHISEEGLRPEVFENVLEYIYTGKIQFTSQNTLETMRIAHYLDIPALRSACEQYFLEKLSAENCCMFFMDSLSMLSCKGVLLSPGESVAITCRSFIEENASEVVKTKGFLNLSKEALMQLVSSDKFALPEEEVWHAVLNWSKHKADVQQAVKNWTDRERQLVCEHLSDVIGHVRLLLIDSKVFADEVEPTGAVPLELSLERYRYAAVPDKFDACDDVRLRRRVNRNCFQGTTILCKNKVKYQEVLNNWFGNPKQEWSLLYRATRDGFSAQRFHEKCDGVAQTYTIVKGCNGNICGGFSDVPWKSEIGNGKYSKSTRCFIFTLVNSQSIQPTRFNVLRPKFAILNHSSLGPTFGAGSDLCLADGCDANINSYSNMPHTYGGALASETLLMDDLNFKVAEYEVFSARSPTGR